MTVVALPDHTLIFCGLLSIYFLQGFFERSQPDGAVSYRGPYLGALFLGLATLSKYNGAFIGVGLALAVLLSARFRPLLTRWQLYAAAAIAIGMQAPVLIWNIQQHFASFAFALTDRHHGLPTAITGVILFVVGMVVFLSPFLLPPFIGLALDRPTRSGGDARRPARATLIVSTLTMLLLSLSTTVFFHGTLSPIFAALPYLALYLRWRWLLVGQVIYGALFVAGVAFNYTAIPFNSLLLGGDEASSGSMAGRIRRPMSAPLRRPIRSALSPPPTTPRPRCLALRFATRM